jgi:LmbE family N-acetylglucosaminyl deacetylase
MSLRLLCVVAHPDDECFAFGGALALAADQGAQVSVLCLTDGQAATHRGSAQSGAELGRMRREEFARSCEILGAQHHELLTYADGQLENHTLHELGGIVLERMRRFRPHVVLTFGGEGALNNHPDHTAVSAAATAAFHWSGNAKRFPEIETPWRPQRLFYLTYNFFLPDRPAPLVAPWTTVLDIRSVAARKFEAFKAHTSQAPLIESARPAWEEHGNEERYVLAYANRPQPAAQGTDIFDGVVAAEAAEASPNGVR